MGDTSTRPSRGLVVVVVTLAVVGLAYAGAVVWGDQPASAHQQVLGAKIKSRLKDGAVLKLKGRQEYYLYEQGARRLITRAEYRKLYWRRTLIILTRGQMKKIPLTEEVAVQDEKSAVVTETAPPSAPASTPTAPKDTAPPAQITLTGLPSARTNDSDAIITIQGDGDATHYKYSLNNGPFSEETAISEPVRLTNLSAGEHTVRVLARDAAGNYMTTPAEAKWTVVTAALVSFKDTFDGSAINIRRYGTAITGPGTIKQDGRIIMTGTVNNQTVWNTFYTVRTIDWLREFSIAADATLTATVTGGDAMLKIGVESQDTVKSGGPTNGPFCELSIGPERTILRMEDPARGYKTTSEPAVASAKGRMSLSYDQDTRTLTCAFGDTRITMEYPIPALNEKFVITLRSGLHTISEDHRPKSGGHSSGGHSSYESNAEVRIAAESGGSGSFTATYDNLEFTTQ